MFTTKAAVDSSHRLSTIQTGTQPTGMLQPELNCRDRIAPAIIGRSLCQNDAPFSYTNGKDRPDDAFYST
jgi:hypothetical protein